MKSKSFISNARSSLIRNAEASKELQMVINRRLALLLGKVFKNANHVFHSSSCKTIVLREANLGFGGILIVFTGFLVNPKCVMPKSKISLSL